MSEMKHEGYPSLLHAAQSADWAEYALRDELSGDAYISVQVESRQYSASRSKVSIGVFIISRSELPSYLGDHQITNDDDLETVIDRIAVIAQDWARMKPDEQEAVTLGGFGGAITGIDNLERFAEHIRKVADGEVQLILANAPEE